ncbi:MAG: Gfo/Idh/MocA family protein [Janthinobacterium lividum]
MSKTRFGVGIIGLQPGRSWAAVAHVPALRALADDFDIVGVANTTLASAEAAANVCGLRRAFANPSALIASPEVDIVVVTVKVPHHFLIVREAIAAGKHVYCEWPLGNGLGEARELARLAQAAGIVAVAGTQARVAPEIQYLRHLIADGYVGDVLSTSLIGSGRVLGPTVEPRSIYLMDRANGANMLTIPVGHTLAAVREVLGEVMEVSARLANRRTSARVNGTGEVRPMTAHDQVLMEGVLESGAPISLHYRGGTSRGTGLLWEINGTEGDIQVSGADGHAQMVQLALSGGRGDERTLQAIEVPASFYTALPDSVLARNVACIYARLAADLRNGGRTAPSFDDAVTLHRLLAAIEQSSEDNCRVLPQAL